MKTAGEHSYEGKDEGDCSERIEIHSGRNEKRLRRLMNANEDLVVRPVTELTEENNEFAVHALVPGVDPNEIEIFISRDNY